MRTLSWLFAAALILVASACTGTTEEEAPEMEAAEEMNAAAETDTPMTGEAFLAQNAAREGVMVTESGLQYEVLREGDGASPAGPASTVTVHYEGTLIDGTVFDSSYARDEQISFPLNRVISGWTEGLQLMNIGSKYRLFLPPDLGYGERGAPPVIPANATLIFDVELFDVQD